jgi:hypothetical protein
MTGKEEDPMAAAAQGGPQSPDFTPPERPFHFEDSSRVSRSTRVQEFPLGDDEMMLYLDGRQAVHALNTSAWAVWDLCDGSRTVAELARELSAVTGHPVEEVLVDVRSTIARLGALALLDVRP